MVVGSSMFGQHTATFVMRNGHKQQFTYPNKAGVTGAIDAMDQYLAIPYTVNGYTVSGGWGTGGGAGSPR